MHMPNSSKVSLWDFFFTWEEVFYSPGMGNTAVFTLRDNHAKHCSFLNLKIVSSSVNQNLHNLVRYVCLSTCIIQNNLHLQNPRYWKEEKVPTFRLKYPRLNQAESQLATVPSQRVFRNFPWFIHWTATE